MRRASRKSGSLSVSASEYSFLSIRTGTRDSKRFRWFFRVSTLRPTAPAADPPGPRPRRWSRARIRRIARRWRESRRVSLSPAKCAAHARRTRRSVGPAPSRDRTRRRARRSPRRPRRRSPARADTKATRLGTRPTRVASHPEKPKRSSRRTSSRSPRGTRRARPARRSASRPRAARRRTRRPPRPPRDAEARRAPRSPTRRFRPIGTFLRNQSRLRRRRRRRETAPPPLRLGARLQRLALGDQRRDVSGGELRGARRGRRSAASNADAARPNAEATAVSNASRWAVDQAASGEARAAPSRDRHCVRYASRARSSSVCACATKYAPPVVHDAAEVVPRARVGAGHGAFKGGEGGGARRGGVVEHPRAAWHSATFPRASPRFQIASKHAAEARARLCSALCALCKCDVVADATSRVFGDCPIVADSAAASALRRVVGGAFVRSLGAQQHRQRVVVRLVARENLADRRQRVRQRHARDGGGLERDRVRGRVFVELLDALFRARVEIVPVALRRRCQRLLLADVLLAHGEHALEHLHGLVVQRHGRAAPLGLGGEQRRGSGPTRAATSVADAVADANSASARIASCLLSGFAAQYACESFVASSNALRIARDTSVSASRVDAAATAPSRDNFLSAASRLASAAAITASAPTGRDPSSSRAFLPRALADAEALAPRLPRRCGGT